MWSSRINNLISIFIVWLNKLSLLITCAQWNSLEHLWYLFPQNRYHRSCCMENLRIFCYKSLINFKEKKLSFISLMVGNPFQFRHWLLIVLICSDPIYEKSLDILRKSSTHWEIYILYKMELYLHILKVATFSIYLG